MRRSKVRPDPDASARRPRRATRSTLAAPERPPARHLGPISRVMCAWSAYPAASAAWRAARPPRTSAERGAEADDARERLRPVADRGREAGGGAGARRARPRRRAPGTASPGRARAGAPPRGPADRAPRRRAAARARAASATGSLVAALAGDPRPPRAPEVLERTRRSRSSSAGTPSAAAGRARAEAHARHDGAGRAVPAPAPGRCRGRRPPRAVAHDDVDAAVGQDERLARRPDAVIHTQRTRWARSCRRRGLAVGHPHMVAHSASVAAADERARGASAARVHAILAARGLDELVLRDPANLAWYLGGARVHVVPGEPIAELAVEPRRRRSCARRVIEAPRLAAEELGRRARRRLRALPWWEPLGPAEPGAARGSDRPAPGERDVGARPDGTPAPHSPSRRSSATARSAATPRPRPARRCGTRSRATPSSGSPAARRGALYEREIEPVVHARRRRGAAAAAPASAARRRRRSARRAMLVVVRASARARSPRSRGCARSPRSPPAERAVYANAARGRGRVPRRDAARRADRRHRRAPARPPTPRTASPPTSGTSHHQGGPNGYTTRDYLASPATRPRRRRAPGLRRGTRRAPASRSRTRSSVDRRRASRSSARTRTGRRRASPAAPRPDVLA